jgi:hypothetical protein
MTVYKNIAIDLPGSRELAELDGIIEDLKWVEDACSKLVDLWKDQQRDTLLLEGLSAAALVRYFRCFSSGVRPRLPSEIIESAPGEWRKAHQYYKDVRDKHVAHSVNLLEENVVTATVPESDLSSFKVEALGFYHLHLSPLEASDAENLRGLAQGVRLGLEEKKEAEVSELLMKVREVPIEDLVAKDLFAMRWPQLGDESKRR